MPRIMQPIRRSLVTKLILTVGLILIVSILGWSYYSLQIHSRLVMTKLLSESDRLSNLIKLGTRRAMMLNSREDIAEIIKNISLQHGIENIRIYNKEGQIKFSNAVREIDRTTNIKAEACFVCHRTDPPMIQLALPERTRIFHPEGSDRLLGILNPIYNEPSCSAGPCHVHPRDKRVLGALDVVFSLGESDRDAHLFQRTYIALTLVVLLLTSAAITVFVFHFVRRPVRKLIAGTELIAGEGEFRPVQVGQMDELGQLAEAINHLGLEIRRKQEELNRQAAEYQQLFELVPCVITVQDREYKLLNYNREFADKFDPQPDDHCYRAFKGLSEKCPDCPVERTFEDGLSHHSEESGLNRDGTVTHWIAITSPIKDQGGRTVAAMEVSLDITDRKQLETRLEESEQKYHAIFNNIPNPVFVLDSESLEIIDCNDSLTAVYGYHREEVLGRNFVDFFIQGEEPVDVHQLVKSGPEINQARHRNKDGKTLFVNIRVSPSAFKDQKVILVTISDITRRLEAEQQLQQASKLATLGEMATGVAHELNQPLSVIKTVSSFFLKKIRQEEPIDEEVLRSMLAKVDSNVDRAGRIITHMRLFARKSDLQLIPVDLNEVLRRSFEIFSQQLKLRGIEVVWELEENLPEVLADPDRLEQVFINLLINARDALTENWEGGDKIITLKTKASPRQVIVEIADSGPGIKEDHREKIFDPFFTTKEVGKGTGLGLSISYGIIKNCRGAIRVVSGEGEGARFVMAFPVAGGE